MLSFTFPSQTKRQEKNTNQRKKFSKKNCLKISSIVYSVNEQPSIIRAVNLINGRTTRQLIHKKRFEKKELGIQQSEKKMLESLVKQNKHFGNAILALRP